MLKALRRHWPEYLIEAGCLAIFMMSAAGFVTLLEHPDSPVRQALQDGVLRRVLIGMAMGATAVALIYSPWGKRSGAHMNPAVTLTFLRLGKIGATDALFYVAAQFAGAVAGVVLASVALSGMLAHPAIGYIVTLPGPAGPSAAFLAELAISFGMMLMILSVSNTRRLNRYTGLFAGILVAAYIALEAPLSGMSMNPARSFGSALPAHHWTGMWIYFTAPLLGMLLAAQIYSWGRRGRQILCAKLHHENNQPCIFICRYGSEG